MAIKDIFKVSRKTFFNPTDWIGYNELKTQNLTIWDTVRGLFYPPKPRREESFENAVTRLHLKEEDIKEAEQDYFYFAVGFLILSILSVLISIAVGILYQTIAGFILGLAMGLLFLGQAFRNHFFYFQIKNRKLGCTLEDWKNRK